MHSNTTNYTSFKKLLRSHTIVEADDVEAHTYEFQLRGAGKIVHRRKGTQEWSVVSVMMLADQFLIGGMMITARVG